MKPTVPNVSIARATVARLGVGQVEIGQVTVGQLTVSGTTVAIRAGHAQLRNVVVTVSLRFDVVWRVHIGLPWPFDDINVGGTDFLGSLGLPLAFGNAEIPSLRSINLNITQLTGTDVNAQVDPIRDLQLDAIVAEGIRALDATAPVQGFTLSGLGLTSLAVDGAAVPAASVRSATVQRVSGQPVLLGDVRLRDVALAGGQAQDIISAALDVPVTRPAVQLGPLPLGVLSVGIKVTPSARMHIDRLHMTGIALSANLGAVELRDVHLPYEAVRLTLSDVGIEQLGIPNIGVT